MTDEGDHGGAESLRHGCAAVGSFAALRMRRTPCGCCAMPPSPLRGEGFGRSVGSAQMSMAFPSSVTANAVPPSPRGRLFVSYPRSRCRGGYDPPGIPPLGLPIPFVPLGHFPLIRGIGLAMTGFFDSLASPLGGCPVRTLGGEGLPPYLVCSLTNWRMSSICFCTLSLAGPP